MFNEPQPWEDFRTILKRTIEECAILEKRLTETGYLEWNKTRIDALASRILALENPSVSYGQIGTGLVSQATQQQATEHLYAPLRNDTKAVLDLAAFARRLLNPDDLGHAVTQEVRDLAREALGLK